LARDFVEINLDDYSVREAIAKDPVTFLSQFDGRKVLIDEAQLVPEVFSAIKLKVDKLKRQNVKRETVFRLTGSNQILLDKNVKESLAGRASFYELNTLSVSEIKAAYESTILDIIFKGGWPELYVDTTIPVNRYLDDYLGTYVEKDIVISAGVQRKSEFIKFIKLLAGRVGHLVNYSNLANEVGVSSEAIKGWMSLLEQMKVIFLAQPYFSNLSKRLTKSPKVFFLDTAIACRLQGHLKSEPLMASPFIGNLFESLVCAEIYKVKINHLKNWNIYHWRSRDGEEIDFFIELEGNKKLFLEVNVNRQSIKTHTDYSEVKKVFKNNVPDRYICHMHGDSVMGQYVPISCLAQFLLEY